jgi:arylsulfatase A-like enzyme/Flp pilus assembly protein TadD
VGKQRSLVLIIIDTLRADRLGFMGYQLARTPNLDSFAGMGTRFQNAMTPVPVTLPAIASLLTGRLPFHHGVRDNDRYVLGEEEETLAERLRASGWRTGAVVASAVIEADRGLNQGFEVYDDDFSGPYPVYLPSLKVFAEEMARTVRRADEVTDRAVSLLDDFGDDPFFLLVHYFDVHSHYDPPPEFAKHHPGRPYDGEISFVDHEIGRLLRRLRDRPDALVVVVSDHGEGLGEHGEPEHGFLLYQSTLWVPVVAVGPGVPQGAVRSDPISLVDLEPTLASHFGLDEVTPERDGRVLDWAQPEADEHPIYAETFRTAVSYHWSELRAIRRGPWKMIYGPPVELYDLERDPKEEADLGERDPAPELVALLSEMTAGETRAEVLARLRGGGDPERRKLLESLGYISGPDARSDNREYPHPGVELPRWIGQQERRVLYRKGVLLATQGKCAQAVAILDSVIALEPDRTDARFNRALCRRKLGDRAGFESDISSVLEQDPDHLPSLKLRARDAASEGGSLEAIELWRRVHAVDGTDPDALRALGENYLRSDELAAALPYLRSLVNELPRDAPARLNLGLAAWQLERYDEARVHLQEFLELAPEDPQAAEVRQLLELEGG